VRCLDKSRPSMPIGASPRLPARGWNPVSRTASMHPYRTHTCGELRLDHVGRTVRLSGWVHRKRDHGHLLFVDLRDHYGITQCVFDAERAEAFAIADGARLESVLTVTGDCVARSAETVNAGLPS